MLKVVVDESIGLFLNDLKLVNFRGYSDFLPVTDVRIGDVWSVGGKLYVCEVNDPEKMKWRRICTEDDLSAYYTKIEFDEKYRENTYIISALVDDRLYEYSEDFKNRFITKDEAEEFITTTREKLAEYDSFINGLREWRTEQQNRVDEYASGIEVLSSLVQDLAVSQNDMLSSWMNEQSELISQRLSDIDEKQNAMEEKIVEHDTLIHLMTTEIAILSGALEDIRKGKQQVLGERYEA